MLFPRQQKYPKQQKGKAFNRVVKTKYLENKNFWTISLRAVETGRISAKQIEAMYQCLNKKIKKLGRVTLNIFPQTPITKKPIETRMGKGKGNVELWVAKIKAGVTLVTILCMSFPLAYAALIQAQKRLPLRTKIY
jgi:large subunit ribosomal protein L16